MPMVGHLAEAEVVIHDDFPAGNVAPASANLDFVKACEATGKTFAIGRDP